MADGFVRPELSQESVKYGKRRRARSTRELVKVRDIADRQRGNVQIAWAARRRGCASGALDRGRGMKGEAKVLETYRR